MSSLAIKKDEEEFKRDVLQKDPGVLRIRTYFLSSKYVNPSLQCCQKPCLLTTEPAFEAAPGSSSSTTIEPQPMCFCFSCNRVFHLLCLSYDLELFKLAQKPFLCRDCVLKPTNPHALRYFKSKEYAKGVLVRRKLFFPLETITSNPSLLEIQNTDDEFEEEDEKWFMTKDNAKKKAIPIDPTEENSEEDSDDNVVSMKTFELQRDETRKALDYAKQIEELLKQTEKELAEQKALNLRQQEFRPSFNANSFSGNSTSFQKTTTTQNRRKPAILRAECLLNNSRGTTGLHPNVTTRNNHRVSFKPDTFTNVSDLNSSLPSLDDPNLSLTDRLLLASTKANLDNSTAQRMVSTSMQLECIRKALPRITKFKGDAKNWLKFKKDVQRYKEIGQYEDDVLKIIMFGALEGKAEKRVKDLIDNSSLDQIMQVLEVSFGHAPTIISVCENEILKFKVRGELTRSGAVQINTLIQTYMNACSVAGVETLNSNMLANHILRQLNSVHKLLFRQHYRSQRPNDCVQIPDLEIVFTFLEDLAEDLEVKPEENDTNETSSHKSKPVTQLNTTSTTQSSSNTNDKNSDNDYRFKLWDNATAKFLGYDLELVNSLIKKCFSCNSSTHFTLECAKFKAMNEEQRKALVNSSKLCKACLLTPDHQANECTLKLCCGFKMGNARCSGKHHILLHSNQSSSTNHTGKKPLARRNNSRFNTQRGRQLAADKNGNAQTSFDRTTQDTECTSASTESKPSNTVGITQTVPQKTDQSTTFSVFPRLLGNVFTSSTRTVKMFKHIVYGPRHGSIIYSIGDSAAEISLISDDLRQALEIEGEYTSIDLQWKDETTQTVPAIKIDLEVKALDCDDIIVLKQVYAVSKEYFTLPARSLNVEDLKQRFPFLQEAQFESYYNASPTLLIGSPHASCYEAIAKILEGGEGKPIGIKTKLGWSIYGGAPELYDDQPLSVDVTAVPVLSTEHESDDPHEEKSQLDKIFEHFCSIESLGVMSKSTHLTEDEKQAIDIIEKGWKVLPSGSIEVPLAWKFINGKLPKLPNNFSMVFKRQIAHEQKLLKQPDFHSAFVSNFRELLQEGYAREALEKDFHGNWPNVWYLPMSLVVNERKIPVKYRNVYDASAKYQNESLNRNLHKGPKMIVDILKPFFKFREGKFAFLSDVKSMYHRVFIAPNDQQVQRVLFRESPDQPWKTYIIEVMLFGPTSSPFTSQLVKNKVANEWMEKLPESAKTIIHYMYMDDALMSTDTLEKAIEIALGCIKILKSINWDLIGFQSNSKELLQALPQTHIKKELKPFLSSAYDSLSYTTKVLGSVWDPQKDCFRFQYDNDFVKASLANGHIPTKRDQASTIARMFDIRGDVAHYIIRGRILLQRSWRQGIGWDEPILQEDFELWMKWLKDMHALSTLQIPRRYTKLVDTLSKAERLELHVFSDAGKEAFAATAYFVIEYQGFRESALVMAKAKVTPLKRKTKTEICQMPRLELTSCLIATRMAQTILEFHSHLKIHRFMWTDSTIALSWIRNPNSKLEKFAIGMIDEILEKSERSDWRHVPTQINPADIATKFQKFNFGDPNSIWFRGPNFLQQPTHMWPNQNDEKYPELVSFTTQGLCKERKFRVNHFYLPPIKCEYSADFINRLSNGVKSNWMKLLRAVARALKLIDLVREPIPLIDRKTKDKKFDPMLLEPFDYERAELFIARKMQSDTYPDEYKALNNGNRVSNKDFLALRVFMDSNGVLRINSRVALDPVIYPQRYLPLVPRKHCLTEVLLFFYHLKYNHVATDTQVAEIRSRFWIPQVRSAVKKIKTICNYCGYMRAKPIAPPMAPLPSYRVNPQQKPFDVVGLDCTGEITVYKHFKPYQAYILLFTCTLTRFVHVHLLDKMDALSILEAITIFWAAHGPVYRFVSDNGTNFVGAANRLKKDQEKQVVDLLMDKRDILRQTLAEKFQLKWEFIPPYSPWFGGMYERLIKEIKRAIEAAVRNKKIPRTAMVIAINDAAHRMNNRPLTEVPLDAEDQPVLTPHLLAKNKEGWPLLPSKEKYEYDNTDKDDHLIYHRGRTIADQIMNRFVKERLPFITRQSKWFKDVKDFEIGDLVLLVDPNKTRNKWQRAKVVEIYPGRDGRVRVIDVELPNKKRINRYSAQRAAKLDVQKRDTASSINTENLTVTTATVTA